MIGSRFPRYAWIILTLGVALGGALMALLFRQYIWLSDELAVAPPVEHEAVLRTRYMGRAGGGLVA